MKRFQVGAAEVVVINIGDIYLPLGKEMNVPDWESIPELAEQTLIPIHSTYIRLPQTSVLVDAGFYDMTIEPEYGIPGYNPPPSVLERLQELGVAPESIEHVILTHRHWDHFNGLTYEHEGVFVPSFPKAKHYLGAAEWERVLKNAQNPDSVEARGLIVLREQGLLEFVEGDLDLGQGIQILATPGETVGHQIVRIESEGQVLYCLGDLYHHPIEVGHPEWKVNWANADTLIPSRQRFTQRASTENALLVVTHIPTIGKLGAGMEWQIALE